MKNCRGNVHKWITFVTHANMPYFKKTIIIPRAHELMITQDVYVLLFLHTSMLKYYQRIDSLNL